MANKPIDKINERIRKLNGSSEPNGGLKKVVRENKIAVSGKKKKIVEVK